MRTGRVPFVLIVERVFRSVALPAMTAVVLLVVPAAQGIPAPSVAATADWRFDDEYQSPLLYLHPLVNYAFNPVWEREWERDLVRRNGIRITTGSVSTDDLFTRMEVNVTEPIGSGFRFLSLMDWREGLHRDDRRRELFLGFEKSLVRESGLQLLVYPASDKEEADLLAGALIADAGRDNYLRLWLRLDDFLYEQKNGRGGHSEREAIGPQWALRLAAGRWELFSRGRYATPSERVFEDPSKSPEVAGEQRQNGESETRLRLRTGDWAFLELGFDHYRFEEGVAFRESSRDHRYRDRVARGRLLYYFPFGSAFRGRGEAGYLDRRADAEGSRDYEYEREEIPWAAFAEWLTGRSTFEAGYMAGHYRWDYRPQDDTDPYDQSGIADKIQAAWTYAFSPAARIRLSLSHEPQLSRFGGFNVQSQVLF